MVEGVTMDEAENIFREFNDMRKMTDIVQVPLWHNAIRLPDMFLIAFILLIFNFLSIA
mgnify:CR=1 FL=1